MISRTTGRPKTVFVRAYNHMDGTCVRSHYRSLPLGGSGDLRSPQTVKPLKAENGSYYGEPNKYGAPVAMTIRDSAR